MNFDTHEVDPRERASATLDQLADTEQPVHRASLRGLSGLTAREFAPLAERFAALPVERRRRVLRDMVELAEDNVDLDFSEVLKLGLRDPDAEVRRTAVDGLWESDDSRLVEPLIRLAQSDRATAVRCAAASALGRFAYLLELGKLDPALGERLRDALLALVENEAEPAEVRRRALEALSFITGDDVHDLIAEAYRADDDKMRTSAIFAMGRQCDPAWLDVLLNELKSANPEHRFEAARAAGEMEDVAAVPELINLLQDADREVRLAAVSSLGKIGGNQAKRALLRATRDPDEVLASAAEEALEELNFGEDPIAFRLLRSAEN